MATPPGFKPALQPPPGVTPNPADPVSIAKWNVLCVTACLTIATTVFLGRMFARLYVRREWFMADWMCVFAWLGLVAFCSLMTKTFHSHGGIHGWDLTADQFLEVLYWFYVASVVYGPAILFTKLAILLLYRRVFMPHRGTPMDWVTRVFMAILCLFYIAITFVKIFECTPHRKIWRMSVPGTCISVPILLSTSGMFNTVTDFIILLIPMKLVWTMQMPIKRKVGVVAVFTMGLTAPVFSLIGVVARMQLSANPDASYNQPKMLMWAAAEITSGVVCVCIPAIPTALELLILGRRRPEYLLPSQRSHSPNIERRILFQSQCSVAQNSQRTFANTIDEDSKRAAATTYHLPDVELGRPNNLNEWKMFDFRSEHGLEKDTL